MLIQILSPICNVYLAYIVIAANYVPTFAAYLFSLHNVKQFKEVICRRERERERDREKERERDRETERGLGK